DRRVNRQFVIPAHQVSLDLRREQRREGDRDLPTLSHLDQLAVVDELQVEDIRAIIAGYREYAIAERTGEQTSGFDGLHDVSNKHFFLLRISVEVSGVSVSGLT